MSEEQKDSVSEKEKDKSEKLIYVLTGLLVVVIFGAIAVLYFNPSTDEKVYKPEKIQVVKKEVKNNSIKSDNTANISVNKAITDVNSANLNRELSINNTTSKDASRATPKEQEKGKQEKKGQEIGKTENKKIKNLGGTEKRDSLNNTTTKTSVIPKTAVSTGNNKEVKSNKSEGEIKKLTTVKQSQVKENKNKTTKPKVLQKIKISKENKTVNEKPNYTKKVVKQISKERYYYIQVSALASMEKARQVKKSLEGRGFENVIIIKEKGLYKVLIGRFNSMKEAFSFIRKHNIKGGWVRVLKNSH